MTELIAEIAKDMHNHGFGLYQTTNPDDRTIFTGEYPQAVNEGTYLIQIPAPPPHQYVDTEFPVIDFWARSPHTDRAYARLRQVFDLYNRRYHYDLGDWHVYFSQALGSIVDVDRDAESGKLLRLSVQFISRNLNNIS